jgi:hypothetical protein
MPTTDVTNTLIANITSTEQSTSNVDINRGTGNPAFSASAGQFTTYLALNPGLNSFVLPVTPAAQVYIKNIDPIKTVVVNWTSVGSVGSATILNLTPGDQIIFWCSPTGASGITALTMTPSAAGCLVEYFLGG